MTPMILLMLALAVFAVVMAGFNVYQRILESPARRQRQLEQGIRDADEELGQLRFDIAQLEGVVSTQEEADVLADMYTNERRIIEIRDDLKGKLARHKQLQREERLESIEK